MAILNSLRKRMRIFVDGDSAAVLCDLIDEHVRECGWAPSPEAQRVALVVLMRARLLVEKTFRRQDDV